MSNSHRTFGACLVLLSFLVLAAVATAETIYVDANTSTGGDGTTWATAYKYLQDALTDAGVSGNDIWVAAGTYKPDDDDAHDPNGTGLRADTFQLINSVAIYGGFPSGGGMWEQRHPNRYETILSGDLDDNDVGASDPCDLLTEPTRGENSYTVVTATATDATAILDGFTITGGNANEAGGGITIENSSPVIQSCIIRGNTARGNEA